MDLEEPMRFPFQGVRQPGVDACVRVGGADRHHGKSDGDVFQDGR